MVELQYRGENPDAIQKVLDDIYDTAKCIVMRGQDNQEEFDLIQDGIKKYIVNRGHDCDILPDCCHFPDNA